MPDIADRTSFFSASERTPARFSVWNRRLLTAAAVLILWAASMLALEAAGPNARAMLAGEGMLITTAE